MEKLLNKLKNTGIILFVLSLLSLTWLFLDYMILKDIVKNTGAEYYSYPWIMIIISGVILVFVHIWIFATVYYIFRVKIKYKKEQKAQKKQAELKESSNNRLNEPKGSGTENQK